MEEKIHPRAHWAPRTSLVCIENTHNRAGGRVFPQAQIEEIEPADAEARMHDATFLDVRELDEYEQGMIPGAVNIPVGQLPDRTDELDPRRPTVVYCAGGYRSSVAASLLRQRGFADVSDVLGGYGAWVEAVQNA